MLETLKETVLNSEIDLNTGEKIINQIKEITNLVDKFKEVMNLV